MNDGPGHGYRRELHVGTVNALHCRPDATHFTSTNHCAGSTGAVGTGNGRFRTEVKGQQRRPSRLDGCRSGR